MLVALEGSPSKLGIWQLLETRHTCVFPAGDEPDPFLVKEIRSFEPRFVPVLTWKEYRLPNGQKFRQAYHLIAKHVTDVYDPEEELGEPLAIEATPPGFPFVGGGIYGQKVWALPWPVHSDGKRYAWPDRPLPFDRELVEYMREVHHFLVRTPGSVKQKVMERILLEREREERLLLKMQEDTKYKLKQHRRQIRKFIAEDGGPAVGPSDRKPFVHIRVRPRTESEAP